MTRIIIIGAPRSGTNMLRDLLCASPDVATWSCDEINYIWRHGNVRYPSDAFTPQMARPQVRRYIIGRFSQLERRTGARHVVEKTCANSLRVGFVDRVIEEAKYVFIHRNGIDAAASAAKRWGASLDLRYIARKARYVPLGDLPYYATRYLGNRLYRMFSRQRRLAFWGPVLDDMSGLLARHTLPEISVLQWQACVTRTLQDFKHIEPSRVHTLRYEDLVTDKAAETKRLCEFLGIAAEPLMSSLEFGSISASSIGLAADSLDDASVDSMLALAGGTLGALGYR